MLLQKPRAIGEVYNDLDGEVAWINPACADALERVPGGLWA